MSDDAKPPIPCTPSDPAVRSLKIERVKDGRRETVDEPLAVEASIALLLNGRPLARLRCTPCHVVEIVRGFLLTEGLVVEPEEILAVEYRPGKAEVEARVNMPDTQIEEVRGRLSVASGCGGGLSRDDLTLDPDCKRKFDLTVTITADQIHRLAGEFDERSALYRKTKCVHSAAIVEGDRFLVFAEDLGRHNAVDKAVGMLAAPGVVFSNKGLITSGRATLDIAAKMARLRAAYIISRAAPSAEAVEAAERFHVAVVGRLRRTAMKVYSAPWRVKV
ncbi:MAG: formate dehydrogenase accessory sulfurtransferase FdhD [Planctomycetota bacterium]